MPRLHKLFRLIAFLFGDQDAQEEALEGLEIFADESEELAAARRQAEEALKRGGD